ncbi:hypothetical protein B0H11DRAFT_2427795 [Mycena galericulata]|nr:hypothetical protein B0H11DRAFT_2427795 [Mycena galericulata]
MGRVPECRLIKLATKQIWDPIERRIGKSPHFNAHEPTAHIPDMSQPVRDEIGLVRAIAVKVGAWERSSSKRKDLFKTIQRRHQTDATDIAKQMVLDMKVRWSSTYAMLDRAYALKENVDKFVFEITMDETGDKRKKLYAEHAQHRFSSDLKSTLHLALPALESLHTNWTKCADDSEFSSFEPALREALEKVDEYYQKTSNSNAYMLAMILDPARKLSYFQKHWPNDLQEKVNAILEETVRYLYPSHFTGS